MVRDGVAIHHGLGQHLPDEVVDGGGLQHLAGLEEYEGGDEWGPLEEVTKSFRAHKTSCFLRSHLSARGDFQVTGVRRVPDIIYIIILIMMIVIK